MGSAETRRQFIAGTAAAMSISSLRSARAEPMSGQTATQHSSSRGAHQMDYQSTRELVAMLATRQISSVELLEREIARIEKFDPRINAVVVRDFTRAREAAAAVDAALARGERRPLLGIPMTVKEAYNVAGLPTTWGIPAFKGWTPNEDAVAVARLRRAGAIIIGKTNVPFGLSDWQSYNDIYGTTNNPWDLARTPGGSSGGSAAALAAGYVPLEIGSDLGGSIRCPAAFCGVYGHKSSYGLIPLRGHTPPMAESAGGDGDLPVLGPLARTAGDLALALGVLAGPDDRDAAAYRLTLPPPRHDELRSFRVLVIDTHPSLPTSNAIRSALASLSDRLAKAGARVGRETALLPDPAESARIYMRLLTAFISQGVPAEFYHHMEAVVASIPAGDSSLAAWRARGMVLSHRDWLGALQSRARTRRQWHEVFREYDVVVCPIMPTPAFPHDHAPDQEKRRVEVDGNPVPYMDQLVWPGVATLPGLPATVAPIARSEDGLPIGVQIVGPYLEDRTTIAFAALMEREFGGFVPPPGFA
jgi:amidase